MSGDNESSGQSWSPKQPIVRKALQFIHKRGSVTARELVDWDASHGRKLFNWNDGAAADEWRLQQARFFLNSFRSVVNGLRVRAFIHMPANEDNGLEESAYISSEDISKNKSLRDEAIRGIVKRMKSLASELKMWKLDESEREFIIDQLSEAMGFEHEGKGNGRANTFRAHEGFGAEAMG